MIRPGQSTAEGHGSAWQQPRRPMLEARNVSHAYGGVPALRSVSCVLLAGEFVALVGESGSGKTTLLRCFNRLITPHFGTVLVGARNVRTLDPIELRRRMGYVPQEGGLMPHWDVLRNVALVPRLQRDPDPTGRAREALDRAGLAPDKFGRRRPSELSGGQRQRVALARALAASPDVLLMDEPFGALDAITRADLHRTISELRQSLAATTLLVTHDLREAAALADRIAVMRQGRIEQIGTPATLRHEPATEYVRNLMSRFQLATP